MIFHLREEKRHTCFPIMYFECLQMIERNAKGFSVRNHWEQSTCGELNDVNSVFSIDFFSLRTEVRHWNVAWWKPLNLNLSIKLPFLHPSKANRFNMPRNKISVYLVTVLVAVRCTPAEAYDTPVSWILPSCIIFFSFFRSFFPTNECMFDASWFHSRGNIPCTS